MIVKHFFHCVLVLAAFLMATSGNAEEFTNALRAFVQQRVEVDKADAGMVVGIIDEHGPRVVSCGKVDTDSPQEVNGDTLFDIAFVTRTFTALLLEDAIERKLMDLDDPISQHLPASVKMPPRNGKEITLRELALHSSGLPDAPGLMEFLAPARVGSGYSAQNIFPTAGMALLGQMIAFQARTDYESLLEDRVCRPLGMDSTRIRLTPELRARTAVAHDQHNKLIPDTDIGGLMGGVGLHSTANDLLKYLSAQLGLTPSSLTPLMQKTHERLDRESAFFEDDVAWTIAHDLGGQTLIWSFGGGGGCSSFVGMDPERRRGVVVLSNCRDGWGVYLAGTLTLQSKWQTNKRPAIGVGNKEIYDSAPGNYRVSPSLGLGWFVARQYLTRLPGAVIWGLPAVCLAALGLVLARTRNTRRRWIIFGSMCLTASVLAMAALFMASHVACGFFNPTMTIQKRGDQLFALRGLDVHRRNSPTLAKLFPEFPADAWPSYSLELIPESGPRFFDRLTGAPVEFEVNGNQKVTGLKTRMGGVELRLVKA